MAYPLEQDHCRIKRLVNPSLGLGCLNTARCILKGDKAMAMICKEPVEGIDKGDVTG